MNFLLQPWQFLFVVFCGWVHQRQTEIIEFMIDYHAVMQALADKRYQGWVIVEAAQDPALADPYEYACIGYQALRQAALAAGYEIVR